MDALLDVVSRVIAIGMGAGLVFSAVLSAIRSFVLPRSAPDVIVRVVFRLIRRVFHVRAKKLRTYERQDALLAMYAPISLLALPLVWLTLISFGYTSIFWGLDVRPLYAAFLESGSSLLTLGFIPPTQNPVITVLAFTEAALGLLMAALLISYLPTMYSAFSKRETLVNLLETRAGSPPSAVYMFELAFPLGRMDHFSDLWREWEVWFSELDETHSSLPVLAFYRSPQPHHSWITAAGAVLDAASLFSSTLDYASDPQARLCIRAGYLALRHICDFFSIPYHPDPHFPAQPISVTRAEFDEACARLQRAGLPLKPDRDQAWTDFAGWRVNYDATLLALCTLTSPPSAPWSSDRAKPFSLPPFFVELQWLFRR